MNFDEWEKNIIGATGGATPEERFYADQVDTGVGSALGRSSVIQGQQDEAARRQAFDLARAAEADRANQIEDKLDPSKARMVPKEDGGYEFYDGSGEKINVFRFSRITGARPDEILKDSYNPRDQQFVQDYSTLRQFTSAWANGDNETLAKMRAADPDTFNRLVTEYKSPSEVIAAFQNQYQEYFSDAAPPSQTQPRDNNFLMTNKVPYDNDTINALISSTTSQSTLTPTMREREPEGNIWARAFNNAPQNIGKYGPLSIFGGGWAWGGEAQKRREWEERQASNPWAAYQRSIGGR